MIEMMPAVKSSPHMIVGLSAVSWQGANTTTLDVDLWFETTELDLSTGYEVGEEGYKALSDVRPDFGRCPRVGQNPDTRTADDRALILVSSRSIAARR